MIKRLNTKGIWWGGFLLGGFFQGALRMIHQDILGKTQYLAAAGSSWVELSPWWGFGALLVCAIMSVASLRQCDTAQDAIDRAYERDIARAATERVYDATKRPS